MLISHLTYNYFIFFWLGSRLRTSFHEKVFEVFKKVDTTIFFYYDLGRTIIISDLKPVFTVNNNPLTRSGVFHYKYFFLRWMLIFFYIP